MNKRRYKGFDYEARNPAPAQGTNWEEARQDRLDTEMLARQDRLDREAGIEPPTSVEQEDAEANEVRLQE